MLFVRDRMTTHITVTVPLAHEQWRVFIRERCYESFKSRINASASVVKITDDAKRFGMLTIGGGNPDHNFDLYYLKCESGGYWVHARLVEDHYFRDGCDRFP